MKRRTFLQIAGLSALTLSAAHVTFNPKIPKLPTKSGTDCDRVDRLVWNPHRIRWCHLYAFNEHDIYLPPLVTESKVGNGYLQWRSAFTHSDSRIKGITLVDDESKWVLTRLISPVMSTELMHFCYTLMQGGDTLERS